MNNIGNKQFLDETGLRHVFELIKDYFKKYVSKEDFIKSELTISESLNDLNERIENIDVPDTSGFVTSDKLNEEVQKLDDKIDEIQIPDTSDFVTSDKLNEEVQRLDDKIDNLPTGSNLQAGNNIKIDSGKINAEGYNYKNSSTGAVTLTLNYGGDNVPSVHNAGGNYTTVCGFNCKTTDGKSSANSFCGGDECIVSHQDCFVYGEGLKTSHNHQTIIGKYNNFNYSNWGETYPLFIVGDGESNSSRRTILISQKNNGNLLIAGNLQNNNNCDFGEYFEWVDSNPDNEDRIGYMVQSNNGKIELAKSLSQCIGIISGTAGFIGNTGVLEWTKKYMTDEWGRLVYNENGELILNPNYDPELEYIPREQRKEWDIVGLIGQIRVRQDGTLKVGGFAGCKNGIATDATKGYRVLSIINENIALVLVK